MDIKSTKCIDFWTADVQQIIGSFCIRNRIWKKTKNIMLIFETLQIHVTLSFLLIGANNRGLILWNIKTQKLWTLWPLKRDFNVYILLILQILFIFLKIRSVLIVDFLRYVCFSDNPSYANLSPCICVYVCVLMRDILCCVSQHALEICDSYTNTHTHTDTQTHTHTVLLYG